MLGHGDNVWLIASIQQEPGPSKISAITPACGARRQGMDPDFLVLPLPTCWLENFSPNRALYTTSQKRGPLRDIQRSLGGSRHNHQWKQRAATSLNIPTSESSNDDDDASGRTESLLHCHPATYTFSTIVLRGKHFHSGTFIPP